MSLTTTAEPSDTAVPDSIDELAAFLATAPVRAATAARLSALEPEALSPAGRIDARRALERHAEWIQARQVHILVALDADPVPFAPGHPERAARMMPCRWA